MTNDIEHAEQLKALEEFAHSAGQPNQPRGHVLVRPTSSLMPIGAQPVAAHRDEAKILKKLSTLAAAAGSDWFYRYPARNQDGSTVWIEGPSIKLANNVARVFGNCVIETRELDVGDAFVFYARFSDLETGFSMERAYRQRKGQRTFKSKDADRQLDITYQIGQSKSIRNVICNSLQIYCDFAFDEARNSLVEKIGKDLDGWRNRTVEGLARIPVEVHRVERVIGRVQKDWLATDVARIVAMMRAIADGFGTVDETFPPDAEVKAPEQPVSSVRPMAAQPDAAEETTAAPSGSDQPQGSPPEKSAGSPAEPPKKPSATNAPRNKEEYLELVRQVCFAAKDVDQLRNWFLTDQQRKIRNGAGMVASDTQEARQLVFARITELEKHAGEG